MERLSQSQTTTKTQLNEHKNMPLKHSAAEKAFVQNIKTEIAHGKPPKQAAAIAYSVQKEAARKQATAKKR